MGKKAKARGKKKDGKKAALIASAEAAASLGASSASLAAERPGPDTAAEPALPRAGSAELAARLASLGTVLQRHLSRADAGDGLTRARLSALALLVLGGPRTLGELAAAEHVRPPTMTRLIHAMEGDGLVAREPNPADARSVIIRATGAGEARLAMGRARQMAPLAASIAALDAAQQQQLEDAADLLGRVLREAAWEPTQRSP